MAENFKNDVEKLKCHLTILLDMKIDQPAEEIDTKEVERILEMMEMCEEQVEADDMDQFAEDFNSRYQTNVRALHRPRKHGYALKLLKMASCFIFAVCLFCGTEFIAVNAFDFSVIQFIRATAHRLVFQVNEQNAPENTEILSLDGFKNYEDLSKMLNINFLVPGGRIESFKLENLEYSEFSDSIVAAYQKSDFYAIWEIILPVGQGTIDYNMQGIQAIEEEMPVGDKKVSVYSVQADDQEAYTATFVYKDILYILESNLPLEDIITIIKEAKEIQMQ